MNIMPILLRSKGNKTMKFDQLIEYKKRKVFFSKTMQKMRQGDYFQSFLFLFYFIFFSSYNSKKELAQDHVGLIIKSLVSLSKTSLVSFQENSC